MSVPESLRVVLFVEGDYWIAQGLEVDQNAHARTPAGALANLRVILRLRAGFDEKAGRPFLSRSRRADDEMFTLFEEGLRWACPPKSMMEGTPPFSEVRMVHRADGVLIG
jgi:hypothetical protein